MSNWQDKSDFEINKAVAELKGFKLCKGQHYKPSVAHWQGCCEEFNPCNNPKDAWPIINENKISIVYRDNKKLNPTAKRLGSDSNDVTDKNPFRAAMIVYLEMKNA